VKRVFMDQKFLTGLTEFTGFTEPERSGDSRRQFSGLGARAPPSPYGLWRDKGGRWRVARLVSQLVTRYALLSTPTRVERRGVSGGHQVFVFQQMSKCVLQELPLRGNGLGRLQHLFQSQSNWWVSDPHGTAISIQTHKFDDVLIIIH
jgi:hypothetical protein